MIVEQKGMTRSKTPRVILTCSPEEASIIRNALLHFADTQQDERGMSGVCDWCAKLGTAVPDITWKRA